jgi:hypothetical protein
MRGEPIGDLPEYRLVAGDLSFIISAPEQGDPSGEYFEGAEPRVVSFGVAAGDVTLAQRLEGARAHLLDPRGGELAVVVVEKADAQTCVVVARVEEP